MGSRIQGFKVSRVQGLGIGFQVQELRVSSFGLEVLKRPRRMGPTWDGKLRHPKYGPLIVASMLSKPNAHYI